MVQQDRVSSGDLALRLYAAGRGLEDEGQNNIAKLFRAAALSEMYRASQDRPRQGAGLEGEMRSLVDELSSRETTPEPFKQAMSDALAAFERGEWPLLTDIPQVHVCRFCGEVMLGERPDHCPGCRARPLSFDEALPVFYLEPLSPDEVRQALRDNLADVERSVDGSSEEDADQGVWPMRDILSHLHGAQELMYGRAKRMLAEDNPDLGSVPPTDIGRTDGVGPTTISDLLDAYRTCRSELIDFSESLQDSDFARSGYHPEWGPMTVLTQLTYLVRHEQSHLAELEARRNGQ